MTNGFDVDVEVRYIERESDPEAPRYVFAYTITISNRGEEAAQRIRAQADRTVVELVSDAQREGEIVRGEADANRNAIFADAYGADEEFFRFYRSLAAYERALQGENSTLVITPDSEFFEFLDGAGATSATAN